MRVARKQQWWKLRRKSRWRSENRWCTRTCLLKVCVYCLESDYRMIYLRRIHLALINLSLRATWISWGNYFCRVERRISLKNPDHVMHLLRFKIFYFNIFHHFSRAINKRKKTQSQEKNRFVSLANRNSNKFSNTAMIVCIPSKSQVPLLPPSDPIRIFNQPVIFLQLHVSSIAH